MVRLPPKLARSLRPYEAVTSSSLEVNTTNREVVSADNNNNNYNNNNTFRTSKSIDTSYDDRVELVDHGESSLFENESNAIEDINVRSKPNCLRRSSSSSDVSSNNDDIELAIYQVNPSDKPTSGGDDNVEIISQDEDSSWSSSQENTDNCNKFRTRSAEQIDPFSIEYVGIGANYFSVGLMLGASLSLMYPVLVVKGGSSSSFLAASQSVIMLFWSYKIVFGFLSDW